MRLPAAPARIRERDSFPHFPGKKFRAISTATTTDAPRDTRAKSQVIPEKLEKAAPVFWV